MKILVTGCAGFIGFHLTKRLLDLNHHVFGLDNLNKYYDVKLKKSRLKILKKNKRFFFKKKDLMDKSIIDFYKKKKPKIIIHLAAQAGVRYSIDNPRAYINSNLIGFFNILELSKILKIKHMIMASSSSVYGLSNKFPLKENFKTDLPVSLYSATKKSNEVIAYSYSKIHKIPISCLRFFTVYGPYGRPDMSLFKFCKGILDKKKIELFNRGKHERDFTYIDDAVEMTTKLIHKFPKGKVPFDIFNISNSKPLKLSKYLNILENCLEMKAKIKKLPLQRGDVFKTHGSNKKILKRIGKTNITKISEGIKKFTIWYKNFYKNKN